MAVQAGTREEHRYQLCRDEYCDRFPCRLYKEGFRNGREEGFRNGYDEGYADGYGAGFSAGLASCPGPHSG
jgi:flagellar biosynthesis/type III secretory pathway protein FliH